MSYNIGLSGLRTTNQSLDVISQNIANVSTAGFKASRAELAALYSGGQAGGVEMQRVSQNFNKDGTKEFTGRDLDMAISGQGFFMVKDESGQMRYSRAGMFNKDANNYIVSSSGMRLQGYAADASGNLVNGVLTDLQISASSLPAQASTSLEFVANFKADAAIPTSATFNPTDSNSFNFSYSSDLYDSLGTEHTLTQYLVKTADNQWMAHYYLDGNPVDINGTGTNTQAITFNPDGSLNTPTSISLAYSPAGADPMNIDLSLVGSTQFAGDFSVARNATDGYPAGELTGLRVDESGVISAVYTNGRDRVQGKVILANFSNPGGLNQADSTTWTQSFASGTALMGEAGTGALGTLTAGAFEGSNVDLTAELVSLMTAQRNYQANAKSVSTADKLTQVLFNTL